MAKVNIAADQAPVGAIGFGAAAADCTPVSATNPLPTSGRSAGLQYETVAASQSAQAMGATGAAGDYLSHVNVQPTSTTVGVVTILDNAVEVHAYPGGTVGADLKPFTIPLDLLSVSGAWKITTGAGVKATGCGRFT